MINLRNVLKTKQRWRNLKQINSFWLMIWSRAMTVRKYFQGLVIVLQKVHRAWVENCHFRKSRVTYQLQWFFPTTDMLVKWEIWCINCLENQDRMPKRTKIRDLYVRIIKSQDSSAGQLIFINKQDKVRHSFTPRQQIWFKYKILRHWVKT